jgi:MFS transporter, putative metabolite:H+ symporter
MGKITVDQALDRAGAGRYQRRLIGVFGLVWAADAMQVLAVGFTAASIAATFGLTIPEALQTGTVFFLGMLIGAMGFGRLADKIGRRSVLIITVSCDALFGLLSVFAPDFTILLILRFLTGIAVGGTLPVDYAMMSEFLPAKNRGRWLVALEGFWAIGTLIVALAAWGASAAGMTDAWRLIFAVTALPALIGIGMRVLIPESPLYLLRTGRQDEAREVVNRILSVNTGQELARDEELQLPPAQARTGIFSAGMRTTSAMILAIWFLVSVSYYGVFTWMPAKLASEGFGFVRGYGFLVLVALAQLPGYALAAYGVEKWGRRPTLTGFCLLSALGCLMFVFATGPAVIATSLLLMSFALLGTWGALYAYTPELYPTTSRATGMGAAGAMARLGGLIAPSAMVYIVSHGFGLTIGIFAGLLALAAVASLMIRVETREVSLS